MPAADPPHDGRRLARAHGRAVPARLRDPPLRPAAVRARRRRRGWSRRSFRPAWSWFDGNSRGHASLQMRSGTRSATRARWSRTGSRRRRKASITLIGRRGRCDSIPIRSCASRPVGRSRELAAVPFQAGSSVTRSPSSCGPSRAACPEVGLDEHVRSLSIVFAIIESARTGQAVACGDPFVSK